MVEIQVEINKIVNIKESKYKFCIYIYIYIVCLNLKVSNLL